MPLLLVGCVEPDQMQQQRIDNAVSIAVRQERAAGLTKQRDAVAKATQDLRAQLNRSAQQSGGNHAASNVGLLVTQWEARLERTKTESFEKGQLAGELAAAAKHFERGLNLGRENGRIEGKQEAIASNEAVTERAVTQAVAEAERRSLALGLKRGHREAEADIVAARTIPAIVVAAALTSLMAFIAVHLDRRGAAAERKHAERDRRQWQEDRRRSDELLKAEQRRDDRYHRDSREINQAVLAAGAPSPPITPPPAPSPVNGYAHRNGMGASS
ncbi:hypothetical protein [Rhodopirellula bahusiensis]